MIYRGLSHFYMDHHKGLADDPVKYFAAPENQDLGIVKQQRKPNVKLIVLPFPDRQRSPSQFFFQPWLWSKPVGRGDRRVGARNPVREELPGGVVISS